MAGLTSGAKSRQSVVRSLAGQKPAQGPPESPTSRRRCRCPGPTPPDGTPSRNSSTLGLPERRGRSGAAARSRLGRVTPGARARGPSPTPGAPPAPAAPTRRVPPSTRRPSREAVQRRPLADRFPGPLPRPTGCACQGLRLDSEQLHRQRQRPAQERSVNFGVFPNRLADQWQGNQYYLAMEKQLTPDRHGQLRRPVRHLLRQRLAVLQELRPVRPRLQAQLIRRTSTCPRCTPRSTCRS